jgi:SET domain-containing protein
LNLQPFGLEVTNWIPAFAGMTMAMEQAKATAGWVPAHQGNDEEMEWPLLESKMLQRFLSVNSTLFVIDDFVSRRACRD